MKIVLTRIDELDREFITRARDAGHEVTAMAATTTQFVSPEQVAAAVATRPYLTIVVTSRRAAPYVSLVARTPETVLACVGPTTRDAVTWEGPSIVALPSNAATLGQLVVAEPMVWLAGSPHREDFMTALTARGLSCDVVEVYRTVAAELDDAQRDALATADAVLCAAPSAWAAVSDVVAPTTRVVALRASSVPEEVPHRLVVERFEELLANG